jgi:copper resistance protein C
MKRMILVLFAILLAGSARLEAHAFLRRAEPAVGSTLQAAPTEVRISFTENIEPAFSTIQVFNASGKEVDKRDVHLDRSNQALLHVSLPPLLAGIYKVVWRVVSVDTHVTNGSFTFRVGTQRD